MKSRFTRREALVLGASAAALAASGARAQTPASKVKAADVAAPQLPIEKGASLRMLRPVRFVQADEDVFRANVKAFSDKTGIEVKVDFVGWEDINQQTAVTANSGAGRDRRLGPARGVGDQGHRHPGTPACDRKRREPAHAAAGAIHPDR